MPGAIATLLVRITSDVSAFNAGVTKATTKLASVQASMAKTGSMLTKGVTMPILALGGIAVAAAMDYGKGMRIIKQETGLVGEAAANMEKSYANVLGKVPQSTAAVGEAIAGLAVRTDLTGPPLERLTKKVLDLGRITGEDVPTLVRETTRVFGDWGVATKDQSKTLDMMYKASTETGIGVSTLSEKCVKFGAPMRQMGFSLTETTALLGKFEKEGVNSDLVMASMRIALGKMAKAGEAPVETLARVTEQIKNAGTTSEANALALQLFGARAGPDMAAAIREGRFEIDDLVKTLQKSPGAISKMAEETLTLSDRFKLLKNKIVKDLQPLGKAMIDAFKSIWPAISGAIGFIAKLAGSFAKLPAPIRNAFLGIALAIAAIGPALSIAAKVIGFIKGIGVAISAVTTMLAANPIVLIIAAVVAVIIGAALLIKKYWKQIGPVLEKVWNSIKAAFDKVWPPIKDFLMAIWTPIKKWFQQHWGQIQSVLLTVWEVIKVAAKVIWETIKVYFQVWFTVVKALFDAGVWAIHNVIMPIWNTIKTVVMTVFDAIKTYFEVVWAVVKTIFEVAWGIIQVVVTTIWNVITSVFHAIWDPFIAVVQAIWNGVKAVWEPVWGFISGICTKVWNGLVTAWHTVIDPLIAIASSIWDGIKDTWASAWNTAVSVVKGIVNGLIDGVNMAIDGLNLLPGVSIEHVSHWKHSGGSVPRTGMYYLQEGEEVISRTAVRSVGRSNIKQVGSGVIPTGGPSIQVGDIHFHSVSPTYDVKQFKKLLDDLFKQGYLSGQMAPRGI